MIKKQEHLRAARENMLSLDVLSLAIEGWAEDRGLHMAAPEKQFLKVVEEVGEVAAAMARGNKEALKDGIGDVFVTIVILAIQNGLTIDECVNAAFKEIASREGSMVDGVFIKKEDLQ